MKATTVALILATSFAIISSHLSDAATDKFFCYYGSWAKYRQGNGAVDVEAIDPNLCTHVIYTFVGLTWEGQVNILDNENEIVLKALERFAALRTKNPSLKVMVAMGGWNEGSTVYSHVASSSSLRTAMVNSVVAFLQKYNFDGFDLDWEYPGMRGGAATDKANFIELLKLFRERFDQLGYILTAAVGASNDHINQAYDVKNMVKYLHHILLMTYDLRGTWDGVTGVNAPLYSSNLESAVFASLNVDAIVKSWMANGATAESLVLGIPLYGRSYTLSSATNNKLGASTTGPGKPGKYTQEPGLLSYLEVCESLNAGGWTTVWNDQQKVPYSHNGTQWVGYDNPESVTLKTNYAKNLNLGGVMVWSIESDDTKGVCGQGKYPLMTSIKTTLVGSTGTGTTTTTTTKAPGSTTLTTTKAPGTTTTTTTTKSPSTGGSFTCSAQGYFRDPSDCNIYYMCQLLPAGTYHQFKFNCPSGLYFDTTSTVCNYPSAVKC